MPGLSDYMDPASLRQLQDALSAITQRPVRLCDPDGEPVLGDYCVVPDWNEVLRRQEMPTPSADCCGSAALDSTYSVPIAADGSVVGCVQLAPAEDARARADAETAEGRRTADWTERLLRLMAHLIGRLWANERHNRSRVEELSTLYRLTALFSGERDLQKVLDLVARTVVEVLDAKACSIRLLSGDRTELLVKSVYNLSPEYLRKGPILLSESRIDRQVLSARAPVYIADERTDPRVLYPEEARREGIVSALCAPLVYKGRAEGVLRVYKAERYEFDPFEVSLLQAVAAQAAAAIVNARLHARAVRAASMKRQLSLAGEVQRRMIPQAPPEVPGFEVAATYVPSYELSGDFYDFIALPEGNYGVAICDVAGKGLRASLLMAALRAALRAHAVNVYEMWQVLAKTNSDLCADTLSSDFATLFYGVLDVHRKRLTYANAGHIPPLLFRGGQVCYLSTGGVVVGVFPEAHYQTESFILQPGDVVVAYTDGLSEAQNFRDEPFGQQRVEDAAGEAIAQGLSAEGIIKHVVWSMRKFAGLKMRPDDLTMVAIRAL